MPSFATSIANERMKPSTPCLLAEYADPCTRPTFPAMDATVMIRPQRRSGASRAARPSSAASAR